MYWNVDLPCLDLHGVRKEREKTGFNFRKKERWTNEELDVVDSLEISTIQFYLLSA